MDRLRSASADVPALTTAAGNVHDSVAAVMADVTGGIGGGGGMLFRGMMGGTSLPRPGSAAAAAARRVRIEGGRLGGGWVICGRKWNVNSVTNFSTLNAPTHLPKELCCNTRITTAHIV